MFGYDYINRNVMQSIYGPQNFIFYCLFYQQFIKKSIFSLQLWGFFSFFKGFFPPAEF